MGTYSNIDFAFYKGAFLAAFEASLTGVWAKQVGNVYNIAGENITLGAVNAVPAVREWVGSRQDYQPQSSQYVITDKVYEDTVKIPIESYRRSPELWGPKVQEMGLKMAYHFNTLGASLLTGTAVGWDNLAFFSASHTGGINLLTNSQVASLDVTTAAAPTPLEMATAIVDTIGYMYTLADESGDAVNRGAKGFMLLTSSPKIWASAQTAVTANFLASGVSNPVVQGLNSQGFNIQPIIEPALGLASSAVFYILRTDAQIKPLVFNEESGIEFQQQGDGSHIASTENAYLFGVKAVRGAGYGCWQRAVKCTLS